MPPKIIDINNFSGLFTWYQGNHMYVFHSASAATLENVGKHIK